MARLLLVSDAHLSPRAPHAGDQWAAVVGEVDRRRPDLVVHAGDISLDGASEWYIRLDGWDLIGLDIQTLASPLPASTEMWPWLEDVITASSGPTALFLHRPLVTHEPGETDSPHRYVTGEVRRRLLDMLPRANVQLVATGHVHQWRTVLRDGVRHAWVPSTWATLPDRIQPRIGQKVTGIVEVELAADVSARLVRPAGLADLTIGDDFESPYGHGEPPSSVT